MQKEEVWAKVGHTEKAQQVLGSELIRALDAPLAAHLNDDGTSDHDAKAHPAQALKERHSLQADLTGAHPRLSCWTMTQAGSWAQERGEPILQVQQNTSGGQVPELSGSHVIH